ncbi:hypothetical protein ACFVH6_22285 [Spirillospora sp. NPDC127200]
MTALLVDRPARPARLRMVTPARLWEQWLRLAEWFVETQDEQVLAAAERLAPGTTVRFGDLCDAVETLAEIKAGTYDWSSLALDEDPERVELQADADRGAALDELYAAAWRRARQAGGA